MKIVPDSSTVIGIVRLGHAEGLGLPSYETAGAAGMDLRAAVPEDRPLIILPGKRALVPTGLIMEIPGRVRGPDPAALRARLQIRHHLPQHARHDRFRLSRRGQGAAGQSRRRAVFGRARHAHCPDRLCLRRPRRGSRSSRSPARPGAAPAASDQPARAERATPARPARSRAATALCRCTIIAQAKSGVTRLSSGTAMKAAITSPARNTVPAKRRRKRLCLGLGAEPHRRELEELAAEQVAVDDEEGRDVDARDQQQKQRQKIAEDDHAEEFQRQHDAGKRRHRAARRIGRIVAALDALGDLVEKEAGDDRRDRRDQEGERQRQTDAGGNCGQRRRASPSSPAGWSAGAPSAMAAQATRRRRSARATARPAPAASGRAS